jgi:hypothetical protein
MKWAALITWILTAGGGFILLSIWLMRGGMRQEGARRPTRFPPPLILGHFLLAAGGLVLWIVYLAADKDALAWIAFVVLAIVAALGWTMFAIWARERQGRARAAATVSQAPREPAEQHFPVPVVALHGVLAVTTVVLVLLTALGVGGS